jgi:hypothetical protein
VRARLLHENVEHVVPSRHRKSGFELHQLIQSLAAEPEPSRVGKIKIHQSAPHADREPISSFGIPRHLAHLEAGAALGEHGPAKQQQQRDFAIVERMEIKSTRTSAFAQGFLFLKICWRAARYFAHNNYLYRRDRLDRRGSHSDESC